MLPQRSRWFVPLSRDGAGYIGAPWLWLVADATLARKHLGWTPLNPDLSTIVSHAWNWERKIARV